MMNIPRTSLAIRLLCLATGFAILWSGEILAQKLETDGILNVQHSDTSSFGIGVFDNPGGAYNSIGIIVRCGSPYIQNYATFKNGSGTIIGSIYADSIDPNPLGIYTPSDLASRITSSHQI